LHFVDLARITLLEDALENGIYTNKYWLSEFLHRNKGSRLALIKLELQRKKSELMSFHLNSYKIARVHVRCHGVGNKV